MSNEPLNAATDNVTVSRLGQIALDAGSLDRHDVGDTIDRGLILLRLLKEAGFTVHRAKPEGL